MARELVVMGSMVRASGTRRGLNKDGVQFERRLKEVDLGCGFFKMAMYFFCMAPGK